jgi:hypothetical protein
LGLRMSHKKNFKIKIKQIQGFICVFFTKFTAELQEYFLQNCLMMLCRDKGSFYRFQTFLPPRLHGLMKSRAITLKSRSVLSTIA